MWHRTLLKLPRGVCLIPDAVISVKQDENILTARLQMDERTSVISALSGDILNDMLTCEEASPALSLADTQLWAQCKQCKSEVIGKVKFRRVLPLPSVDWDQASEGWFCHLHETDGQKLKPQALLPAKDECFFTELFFLLHSDLVESFMEDEQSGNSILCPRCRLPLGAKGNQSSLKLWTHSVNWLGECGTVHYKRNVNEMLLSLLHNIDKDNFGVNCRLVLQTQTAPRQHLYLVTMNTNQKLLVSEDSCFLSNTAVHKSGYCYEVKNGNDYRASDHDVKLDPVPEKRVCTREIKMNLVSLYAVKLMYEVKEGEDEQTGSWVDDANVHIIPCSVPMLQEVRTLLETSNCYLPDNMKVVDNLSVGFIIKNSPVLSCNR